MTMKVLGIPVVRKDGMRVNGSVYTSRTTGRTLRIELMKGMARYKRRLVLMHEVGHMKFPSTQSLDIQYFSRTSGLTPLWMVQEEAAAWRWAVKEYTRREGRRLNEEEKELIKTSFGGYLSLRKAQKETPCMA